jgi:hypothetical protein
MIQLSKQGKALLPIVMDASATPQEKFAAEELRHYLGMMSTCVFTISEEQQSPAIYIGKAAEQAGFTAPQPLDTDGFALYAQNGSVAVLGGVRGVIYGVYALLEELGCRFFTATCEKVPFQPELSLREFADCQVPILEYRDHNYYEFARYPTFAVKSRLNGAFAPIPERLGGHKTYAWFVHTFEALVPPEKYGKEHPEYFALYNGKRHTEGVQQTQLCLSNPEVLEIAVESVRRRLQEVPDAKLISVSQNDKDPGCQCDACRKIDEEEGSPAGTLLRFVNAIAERLEPEFPNVVFDTLAYQYTRPAPKITKPRHNVCVRLCTIECCFAHPLEECDDETRHVQRPDGTRSSLLKDLQDWGKISNRNYIWDYTTCFAHYPTPHPNWHVLQKNIQTFVKNGVKGVFEQANGASYGGTDFNELRAYVISRLLWNPDVNVPALIAEFTDYYYGAAAPFIRQYIELLTDKVTRENIHVGFNDDPKHGFLTNDMLDQYDELFAKAEAAVAGDALRLWRVAKARLSIRYVRLKNNAMLHGNLDREELNRFFADWKAFGLTRIEEWVSPETSLRGFLENRWRGVSFYKHWTDEGGEQL